MRRWMAVVLVVASVLLGGAAGFALQRSNDEPAAAAGDDPTSTPTPTPTPSPTPTPTPSADPTEPVIAPGQIGGVRAGMTKRELEATGEVERNTDSCAGVVPYYQWKGALADVADVLVDPEGTVVSLGVTGTGPRTAKGIGIGSTYGDLAIAYPNLSDASGNDYGQAGVYVRAGDRWMGFLFDTGPLLLEDESTISFIEVSKGRRPGLVRDGC